MPEKLKKGWRTWRFDQMAVMVNDRIDNPSESGVDRYVGLEHLDSDSLTIRRWGTPSDVEATKLRFRAGDIIFGRRRVYQRKLGVPDFDGICSAHAMVLRARADVALPEFLPFFMQSDLFMERAKEISVGSLSPTINWKTLAAEEFALPPMDEQRRMADALEAFRHVGERMHDVEVAIDRLMASWIESEMGKADMARPLGELLRSTEYGCSTHAKEKREGIPILRIPNVLRDELDLTDLKWVHLSKEDQDKYLLREGDILIVRTNGNPEYVGRCLVVPSLPEKMVYASYLIRLVVDPKLARPEYVARVLNSPPLRRRLRGSIRSSAGNFNINTMGIRSVPFPLPSLGDQDRMIRHVARLKELSTRCHTRSIALTDMQRTVMEELAL